MDVDNSRSPTWEETPIMINKPAVHWRKVGRWGVVALTILLLALGPLTLSAYADSQYKVQPGDTLISIAARYGTTVDAIVAANNLPSRSTIYSGQVLTIPSPGSNPAPQPPAPTGNGGTYTVRAGDTLSEIALRYGTTTDAIMRANNLASNIIYAGQVLTIPTAGSQPPAAPPTAQPQQPPASNPGTYVVQSGDSIIGVAAKFGVTQNALAAAN